ncbi:MAG: poly(A) polymerase, partial [Jiangellaceae bacterium]
ERRVVRTIGDPDVRFREDPVRILRAIKFSARLDMGIAPDVYDAMVDHRSELERAARPRLLEEILRLLRGGAAHRSIYLMWDLGVLAELLPEVASYLDDDGPEAELTWGRLDAVDRRQREGYLPTDPVLLAALLLGPIEEAIEDVRDPSAAFADFVEGVAERLVLPRRIKDRLRTVVTSQRRLRSGRLGALPRREYFADAATLFAVDREARGEEIPAWAEAPERADDGSPSSRGRRRRRRRRRRS